jgi:hypothetical protein
LKEYNFEQPADITESNVTTVLKGFFEKLFPVMFPGRAQVFECIHYKIRL